MLCPLTGTSPNGVATAEASPLIVTALSQHIEFIAWQLIPSSTHPNSLTFPPDMLSLNPAIKHFTKSIPFLSITYPNHLTVADITRFTIQSLSCYIHTKIHKHLHITFHLNTPHAPLTYLILTVIAPVTLYPKSGSDVPQKIPWSSLSTLTSCSIQPWENKST